LIGKDVGIDHPPGEITLAKQHGTMGQKVKYSQVFNQYPHSVVDIP